jgi:hypothetical protein
MLVYYTGIGSRYPFNYIEHNILAIMDDEITEKHWTATDLLAYRYQLEFRDFDLPNDFKHFSVYYWLDL